MEVQGNFRSIGADGIIDVLHNIRSRKVFVEICVFSLSITKGGGAHRGDVYRFVSRYRVVLRIQNALFTYVSFTVCPEIAVKPPRSVPSWDDFILFFRPRYLLSFKKR